tara:strand:+ start:201 stop:788 length:588 start_codon:yes stop_codon:yes gene_type:complete
MRNRFNINESEKKRIRGLHGMQVINEVSELDADLSNVSQNESEWEKEWDKLDDKMKQVYRTQDEFKDMEEDEIREKYNNMEEGPLRDIIKNIFSWFRGLFKKDDDYVATPLPEDSPFKKIEGEIFKGVGKASIYTISDINAQANAAKVVWEAAGLTGDIDMNIIPWTQVERGKDGKRGVKQIDGMYINTQYWQIK